MAVLEDPSRQLTLEQILQPDMQQRFALASAPGHTINFGLSHSAVWLRLSLPPPPDAQSGWLLEVATPTLDQLDLYTPDGKKEFTHQHSGDLLPFSARPLPHRNHVFPVRTSPDRDRTLYLRVASDGNMTIPLRLWQPAALARQDHATYAAHSLYLGFLLGLVMYSLLLFVCLRDRLYLSYIGFALGMAVGQLGLSGLGAEFLWPEAPWWGNVVPLFSLAAAGGFTAIFTRELLGTQAYAPRADRLLQALAFLLGLTALGSLLLPYDVVAWLLLVDGIVFCCVLTGVSLLSLLQRRFGAGGFALAWTSLLLGILVMALDNLGLLPSHALAANAMLIGSAVNMLVLSFSLADRIHLNRREAAEARARAQDSERVVLDSLRESERALEGRVQARTQELERANQQLRINEQQLALQAHHDPLTGLANRKLLNDRLHVAMAHAKRNQQGFAVLMLDLNGFKPINDRYGHVAGDNVLLSVALRLTSTVRGVDTVARVGGDEFVLILDTVSDASTMMAIARKVLDALREPITLDSGNVVHISTSIGLAIYPVDGSTIEELLATADQAMYASKNSRHAPLE